MQTIPLFGHGPATVALALALFDVGAIVTFDWKQHRLLIERANPVTGAFERGFLLKKHQDDPGAPLSPILCVLCTPNNPGRPGPLTGKIVRLIARCMYDYIIEKNLPFDAVASVPYSADPIVRQLSRLTGRRAIYMDKHHQNGKRYVGGVKDVLSIPGTIRSALQVDGVVDRGTSNEEAFHGLKAASLDVRDVLVVIDREQGGKQRLGDAGCELHALLTLAALLDIGVSHNRLADNVRNQILHRLQATA